MSASDFFEANQKGSIREGSGGEFEIQAIARILKTIAKKQFAGEQFTRAIQYEPASQIFRGVDPFSIDKMPNAPILRQEGRGMEPRRMP